MSRIFRFMSIQSAYVNLSVSNLARRVFVSALSDSILSCLRTINTFLVPIWKCNIRFASSKLEVCIIYLQKRAVFIADLIYKLLCCSIFTGFWSRIQLRRLIIIMQELLQAVVLLFMNNPFGELLSKSVKIWKCSHLNHLNGNLNQKPSWYSLYSYEVTITKGLVMTTREW